MDDLKLIDLKELARMLQKSTSTIKRWRKEGKLPPPLSGFDKDYWTSGQIRDWVQSRLFGTTQADNN